MITSNKDKKQTVPAKKLKFSTMPVSLEELTEVKDTNDSIFPTREIPFKNDVVFHDEVLKVVVRINDFGVKEILDYDSYIEALNTERQYNEELERFLDNTSPRNKNK
jgi:hypothetical protein